MKPLLFILLMIGIGILISLQFGGEVTWFNYYVGVISGLLVSGSLLEFWTKRRKRKEVEEAMKKRGR